MMILKNRLAAAKTAEKRAAIQSEIDDLAKVLTSRSASTYRMATFSLYH